MKHSLWHFKKFHSKDCMYDVTWFFLMLLPYMYNQLLGYLEKWLGYLKKWICRQDFQCCKQIDYWQFLSAFWWHSPVLLAPTPLTAQKLPTSEKKQKYLFQVRTHKKKGALMRYLHACFFNCQKTDTFVTKEKVRFRWISYCNYITYITLFQLSSYEVNT